MELNKLCPRPNSLYAFLEAITLQREYSVGGGIGADSGGEREGTEGIRHGKTMWFSKFILRSPETSKRKCFFNFR